MVYHEIQHAYTSVSKLKSHHNTNVHYTQLSFIFLFSRILYLIFGVHTQDHVTDSGKLWHGFRKTMSRSAFCSQHSLCTSGSNQAQCHSTWSQHHCRPWMGHRVVALPSCLTGWMCRLSRKPCMWQKTRTHSSVSYNALNIHLTWSTHLCIALSIYMFVGIMIVTLFCVHCCLSVAVVLWLLDWMPLCINVIRGFGQT